MLRVVVFASGRVVACQLQRRVQVASRGGPSIVRLVHLNIAVVGHDIDVLALAAELSSLLRAEVDVVEIGLETAIPLLRSVLRDEIRIYE